MIRWPAERAVCSVRQSARWQHRYNSHSCHEKMYNVRTCVRILSTLLIIILIGKCFLPPVSDDVSVPSRKTVKTEELLLLLAELAVLPPEAPVNQTCRPAELKDWMSPLTLTVLGPQIGAHDLRPLLLFFWCLKEKSMILASTVSILVYRINKITKIAFYSWN